MASPVKVSDAILLSQLAYRAIKSFKDAPAEFLEVQNLVDSVSEALQLLKDTLEEQTDLTDPVPNAALDRIVSRCASTLHYLESILSKYTELDPNSTAADKSKVVKNWKRIKWTKEGGDLSKLKATLTAHISGLHLAVAARNGFKLNQIYRWFVDNLQDKTPAASTQLVVEDVLRNNSSPSASRPDHALFSVSRQRRRNEDLQRAVICPQASFSDAIVEEGFAGSQSTAFRCRCHHPRDGCAELSSLVLVDTAFPSRVVTGNNAQEWQAYVLSPSINTPFVVFLADVVPAFMPLFLHHIYLMSCARVANTADRSATSVVGLSNNDRAVSFVGATCPDVSALADYLLQVQLTANNSVFDIPPITYLQLIQRHILSAHEHVEDALVLPFARHRFEGNAELILYDNNGTKYTCNITKDTAARSGQGSRFAQIDNVLCTQLTNESNQTGQAIQCESVTLEFRNSAAVPTFLDSIRSMQQELFKQHLQMPTSDETVVWHGQSGDRTVQGCYLRNPSVRVLQHRGSQQYRLILMNVDGSSSITVSLPVHVRSRLLIGTEDTGEAYETAEERFPAWFVRSGPEGTTFQQPVLLRELLLPA